MRKVALLTAVLMVLSLATLSAQMMDEGSGLTFEIDGEASVTFGIDLTADDVGTGFDANTASSSVSVTLVSESTSDKMGDMGTYGSITLEDFELGLEFADGTGAVTGASPSVSAEIVSGPLTIGIYSAPSVSVNKVSAISSEVATTYTGSGGVTIGFAQDPIDISIELVSADTPDANTTNSYALEVNAGIGVDPIDIDVAFAYGFGDAYASTPIGIGLTTEIALGSLTPYVAFDLQSDGGTSYEIGAGVTVAVGDGGELTADVEYANSGTIDAQVAFEGDPVPGVDALEFNASFKIEDVSAVVATTWEASLDGVYTMGDVAPYFGFSYDDASTIGLQVGIDLNMIANTNFDLGYSTDDLTNDSGDIDFTITISY